MTRVGIVGVGAISGIYIQNLKRFRETEIVAVADLDLERARSKATAEAIPTACRPDELLRRDDIDIVLDLTVPKAHFDVAHAALTHGKHVYNEKPLTIEVAESQELLELARDKGLLVGCAPDTFMGASLQSCRALIDDGAIGEPVAAQGFMLSRGHETWHPSPEFYYERGGGPMLDMGPYYVTAFLSLLGPARAVSGMVKSSFSQRTITSQPKAGKVIEVETPTHITGEIEFCNGVVAHLTTTFDVFGAPLPNMVVYGSEGTLIVPDPNNFNGEIKLSRRGGDFEAMPITHGFADNSRGVGLLDMALAVRDGRTDHRASGELAEHALEIMRGFEKSSSERRQVRLATYAERPKPMQPEEFKDQIS